MKSKRRNARWVWQVSSLCALAAGAACSGGSGAAPSRVPTDSTVSSSPVVTTTTAELRTLPYPLVDENEDEYAEVRVKFVAYGDVDPNDDIDFGVIPDLQIAVINDKESSEWWNTVGGDNFDELPPGARMFIPPGAQIQSTVENIAASPIGFITTGPDGTAETYLKPSEYFSVCVISPVDSSIAGCNLGSATGRWREMIFYVYLSHGRAYIDREPDGSERYHRFLYEHQDSYNPSDKPATITLVATGQTGTDVTPFIDYLAPGVSIAVVDDADIGAWWTAVSDDGAAVSDDGAAYSLSVATGWEFGWGIPYGGETHERVRQNTPVHFIDIDWPGILEVNMAPGDYLFCNITYEYISHCDYESIAAAQDYVYRVNDVGIGTNMYKLTDNEAKQFLEEIKGWSVRSLYR